MVRVLTRDGVTYTRGEDRDGDGHGSENDGKALACVTGGGRVSR